MRGKDRAALRAAAHRLDAIVHVGQGGITRAVIASLDDVLRTHELVKVQLSKHLDVSTKDAANRLAAETASEVIQVIGNTCTVYRQKPDATPPNTR